MAARAATGTEVIVDFAALETSTTPTLVAGNVTVTGSADINVLEFNGLGIVGGSFDDRVDGSEFIDISFNAGCFSDASYSLGGAGNENGTGLSGDAMLEAFGCGGASLGTVAVAGTGAKDFATLFPGQPISRFRVTANVDSQRISRVTYVLFLLDIDGDGDEEPLTDMLLLLRYGFGFRGAVLTAGAVDLVNCYRCTAEAIEAYIDTLK